MATITTYSSASKKSKQTLRRPIFSFVRKHLIISILAFLLLLTVFGLVIMFIIGILNPNTSTNANTSTQVNITNNRFASTTLNITTGDTVQFKNTTRESYTLCSGRNADCASKGDGPKALYPSGITVAVGHTVNVTFSTVGTYAMTARHIATMNLVITVSQASGDENSTDSTNSDAGSNMNNSSSNTGSSTSDDPSNTSSNTNSVTSPDEDSNNNTNSTGSSSNDNSDSDNSSSSSSSDDGGDE